MNIPHGGESVTADELKKMREQELLEFIRETVIQLNNLGDRLDTYAREKQVSETKLGTSDE